MPEILKNIKAEDRLKKIRIVSENDDVMGGQPEADGMKENDNNAIFDLACSVMHALAEVAKVDQKAIPQILDALGDSRTAGASQRIVNEVNKLAKAAQTAANQANDKANTAQSRADSAYSLGNTANGNANTRLEKSKNLSDLTNVTTARNNLGLGNSATLSTTSTLSDRTDQVATIKVVNDANRAASNAQTAANQANDKANQAKQDAYNADNKALAAQKTANEAKSELSKKVTFGAEAQRVGREFLITNAESNHNFVSLILHNASDNQTDYKKGSSIWLEKEKGRDFLDIKFRATPYVSGQQYVVSIKAKDGELAFSDELFANSKTKYINVDSNKVDVKYYNNRSYPIFVCISLKDSGTGLMGELRVNDTVVHSLEYSNGTASGNSGSLLGVVPPNGHYEVCNLGRKTVTGAWRELV